MRGVLLRQSAVDEMPQVNNGVLRSDTKRQRGFSTFAGNAVTVAVATSVREMHLYGGPSGRHSGFKHIVLNTP